MHLSCTYRYRIFITAKIDKMKRLSKIVVWVAFCAAFCLNAQNIKLLETLNLVDYGEASSALFAAYKAKGIVMSKTQITEQVGNQKTEAEVLVWSKDNTVELRIKRSEPAPNLVTYIYSQKYGILANGETMLLGIAKDKNAFVRLRSNAGAAYPDVYLWFLLGAYLNADTLLQPLPTNLFEIGKRQKAANLPNTMPALDYEILKSKVLDAAKYVADNTSGEKSFNLSNGVLQIKKQGALIEKLNYSYGNSTITVSTNFVFDKNSPDYAEPTYVEDYDYDNYKGKAFKWGFKIKNQKDNSYILLFDDQWSKYLYSGNADIPQGNAKVLKINGVFADKLSQSDIDKILEKEQSVEIEFSANGKKVKFSKFDLRTRSLIEAIKERVNAKVFWQ